MAKQANLYLRIESQQFLSNFIQIHSGSIESAIPNSLNIFVSLCHYGHYLSVRQECVFVAQVGWSSQFNRGLCSPVETMFSEVPRHGFHLEMSHLPGKRWQNKGRKETMERYLCAKASRGSPNKQIWQCYNYNIIQYPSKSIVGSGLVDWTGPCCSPGCMESRVRMRGHWMICSMQRRILLASSIQKGLQFNVPRKNTSHRSLHIIGSCSQE